MKHYCLYCGTELEEDQIICPKCFHCLYIDMLDDKLFTSASGVLTARELELNTQWRKYKCGRAGSAGHGFAAEDGNAWNDRLKGHDVEFSGKDNSKNGPDRIVDGIKIQSKYCINAKMTVNCAFDPSTGMYQYKGQILEVPKDQYEEALLEMEKRILNGQVPGYSDPKDATKIVKCGDYTYKQATNLTKAGNIDSLVFDAKTHTITALSAFGISFAIKLCLLMVSCRSREAFKDSIKLSFLSGLQNGTLTLSSGIMTSQLLKTTFGRNLAAITQRMVNHSVDHVYQGELGKKVVHKLAKNILKKNIYGGAAKNSAKNYMKNFFQTNVITNLSLLTINTLPDTYHILSGNISNRQFLKNITVNSSAIVSSTLGAYIGAFLGPAGIPIGGLIGGIGGNILIKRIVDRIHKDDAEQMSQLVNVALLQLSNDYLIQTEEEFNRAISFIVNEKAIDKTLLRAMYTIGKENNNDWIRVELAYRKLEYYFWTVVRERKKRRLENNQQFLLQCVEELGNDIDDNLMKDSLDDNNVKIG